MLFFSNSLQDENTENFWNFSVKAYTQNGADKILLRLQNDFGLDINLILLLLWLEQNSYFINETVFNKLLSVSNSWQTTKLRPFRKKRQQARNTPIYQALKDEELELEKQEQSALIKTLQGTNSLPYSQTLNSYLKDCDTQIIQHIRKLSVSQNGDTYNQL